jgi:hypothetical protein
LFGIVDEETSSRGVKIGIFIELDVVGTATSVEYLDANFAFGQTGSVEPHNSQNPLQDLSTDHSWFRESTTQYQNITAEILRAESILDVADEVARETFVEHKNLDVRYFMGQPASKV